ncbi:MAG: hypothetical protein ACI9MR_000525 [Myxococcota bacterium]|jgi:hypothetical protein
MSGAFIDMAMAAGVPVVPVRFVGALPVASVEARQEFPVGMGTEDIWIGKALGVTELQGMHYGARKKTVIDQINMLGVVNAAEVASKADAAFETTVSEATQAHPSASFEESVIRRFAARGITDESPTRVPKSDVLEW